MTKNDLSAYAEKLFEDHNCAQSALMSTAEYFGMSNEMLEKISAPFGGGLSGTHVSVCGAVSGALMFIGLKEANGGEPSKVGQELIAFVEEKYGSRNCDRILDIDFNDEEQVEREKGVKRETICTPMIKDICGWLADKYK